MKSSLQLVFLVYLPSCLTIIILLVIIMKAITSTMYLQGVFMYNLFVSVYYDGGLTT